MLQTVNIPAMMLNTEASGDLRCFIMDHHRPIHLANIHSEHQTVVFDSDDIDDDGIPSDGSILSAGEMDTTSEEEEEDDDDDDIVDEVVRLHSLQLLGNFKAHI